MGTWNPWSNVGHMCPWTEWKSEMSKPNNFMQFGLPGDDSKAAAQRLEVLFGISMTRTSRDVYFWYGEQDEGIEVEYNEEEDEDGSYVHAPDYDEFPLLLGVEDVADQDAYEKVILGDPELKATRLIRKVFSKGPRGEVIVEAYGADGKLRVQRFLGGKRLPDEPGD